MNHLLTRLPPFPHVAEIKLWDAHVDRHLVLHLPDLVHAHVGEKVAKLFLTAIVGLARVAPIV